MNNKITIINACTDLGVSVDGASLGPEQLTRELYNKNITEIVTVKTNTKIKEHEKENLRKNLEGVRRYNKELYNKIKSVIKGGNFPLTIGGDHSLVIASALASSSENGKLGIIWIDAHGDFNTFDTTITGNIHGLPLAAITGYEKRELTDFHKGSHFLFENTVIVGGRDIDPLEIENIKDAGITVFTTQQIKKDGMYSIMNKAMEIAKNGTSGIHISYDLDVIDPEIAQGVSIPADNGIDLNEAYEALDIIIKNMEDIRSLDLVEYNPLRDNNNETKNIAITILNRIIDSFSK